MSDQNKKLSDEVRDLKSQWGRGSDKVKQLYDDEQRSLRNLVDTAEREKADSLAQLASLKQTIRNQESE
ncbi:unnamed protein product [Protopolystoma xenopodis]|uniref:Uncharacterized protein n=1 Tax=Protopolystoma xenopodis TaxID=117903 RepID=A0A448XDK4_9PLAT|nr:unnamed protein product [Protopolystoma xenopodis]